ncbi:nucleotide exchange factor GrpE [Pannus brasiliensis CCIBt3594]|uniref:Nucleotide exchange factor GrpE n=1 Tax=Pannus brasiliensis CCIBt3594 TaxID=1427578 RepID=A0AAW9QXJ6_9CHRO
MNPSPYESPRQQLQQLMERVNCTSLQELSQLSGLSSWQLQRVRHGLIAKLPTADVAKLANALQLPAGELLRHFGIDTVPVEDRSEEIAALQRECENLREKLDRQKEELVRDFQSASIEAIESWLVQWPTAEAVARKNTELSAVKILPLVKPLWNLLQRWGVEPIHSVGEHVPYDPRAHQLIDGTAEPETTVLVRYVGYRHGEKLLYRAKVSLVKVEIPETAPEERVAVSSEL